MIGHIQRAACEEVTKADEAAKAAKESNRIHKLTVVYCKRLRPSLIRPWGESRATLGKPRHNSSQTVESAPALRMGTGFSFEIDLLFTIF